MLDRLSNSNYNLQGSIIYSTILINFERIGDHLLNITENYCNIKI